MSTYDLLGSFSDPNNTEVYCNSLDLSSVVKLWAEADPPRQNGELFHQIW